MYRPIPLGRVLVLALAALLALAAPAAANTQQWSEPDESVTEWSGKELDLQSVTISQNATEALFEAEIQYTPTNPPLRDEVHVFVDTNSDGNADRAVGFVGLSSGQYTVEVREVSTSPANCQRLGNSLYTSSPTPLPGPDGAGNRMLQAPFAASHLGSSSYKWAAYVLNDSLTRAAYDYLPNEANPAPGRQNPVSDDIDGCETDGDNDFDDAGADTHPDRAFPVDMAKGQQYGAAPSGGNPPSGGSGGQPPRPGTRITYGLPLIDFGPIVRDKMPQLAPKTSKSTNFITATEAEKRLRDLNVPVTVRLLGRRSSEAESTKQAKWLRQKGKGDEVMIQSVAAGSSLEVPAGAKPKTVKIYYYDRADDIADRNRKCELTSTAKAKAALKGKTQTEAAFELRRLDCTATWTEAPAFGILQPEATSARKLNNGSIEVTIGMPRNEQDLLLIVREDPSRTRSTDLSFTDNWRLIKSPSSKNPSRISVQVVERATGRFVEGAEVSVSDGDTGVETDISNADGEAELTVPFEQAERRTLYAVYNGNNGVTASGWRHLFVADLKGKSFTTASGRRMKSSKGIYKASAASTTAAKRYRYSPATAGAGATGTEIAAPNIVQMQSMTLFRSNRSPTGVAPVIAPHGALDIPRNGSVLVCATRGSVISVSGSVNPITGTPSQVCARTVAATWKAALQDIGTVRSELVEPNGAAVKSDAETAEREGVQVGTPGEGQVGLISVSAGHDARRKGVVTPGLIGKLIDARRGQSVPLPPGLGSNGKIISDNGGGIISEAGGSILSDNGASFVATNGGTWISNNSGNFVSTNGGTFRQNAIGLVPAATFGPVTVYGNGIIGQDVGS